MIRPRISLASFAALGATLLIALHALPVEALPPGGASSDTPGTSSSVSPSSLKACETLSYTVSGFPQGETVYVKIDDGVGYGNESIQGTGVISQQKIDSSGSASGSIEVPCDIGAGSHWLRFLATEVVGNDGSTKGYTNRGNSDFTVVSASQASGDTAVSAEEVNGSASGKTTSTKRTVTRVVQPNAHADGDAVSAGGAEPEEQAAPAAGQQRNATPLAGGSAAGQSIAGSTLAAGASEDVEEVVVYDDAGQAHTAYVSRAQASNGAPTVGLLVGGSILLVGLAGIGAYLYVNRRREELLDLDS